MIIVLYVPPAKQTGLVKQFLRHPVHLFFAARREFSPQLLIAQRPGCHDEVPRSAPRGTRGVLLWVMGGSKTVAQLVYEGILAVSEGEVAPLVLEGDQSSVESYLRLRVLILSL